jgi:serine/threonine-protein kinase
VRLTVETGPQAGTVVPLDRDQPTYLGSGADCALRIQEGGVEPHHAVVKALRDQGFGLKALANGVRVNGDNIEATPLKDGDVIEIGTTRIAFGEVQQRGLPTIPGYRILGELGRGGMGMVYRAEQTSLHRQVALKVLSRERTKDPSFVAKFVAEARAAAKLQHPNVVQVFDVDNNGETYFFAMEVMQGSLEGWLKQNGAMPVDRALQVVSDAASGLAYAESLGIVHRDIKPDNLMLDQHGAVKIADLGLASTVEETEEKAVGTPHFMAPEQVLRKPIDHRTDLYALGCTFYRLVTGKTPFRGQTVKDILRAQVKDEPEPANKANPQVPAEVAAIIGKLMAKAPDQRYQTANDLLEELAALLQPPPKKGLWIGLAAAAVLLAGGAVYWAVTKPKEVVVERQMYDDPEKQRFADENVQLRADLKKATATVALLQARLAGEGDVQITALERVASDHADTPAAGEARQRIEQLRQELQAASAAAAQRERLRGEHLATLQQAQQTLLAGRDYRRALQALDGKVPAELRDDRTFATELEALRDKVLAGARARLAELRGAVDLARTNKDESALQTSIGVLQEALADKERWPTALQDELAQGRAQLADAGKALEALRDERGAAVWRLYATALADGDGVHAALGRADFAAAPAAANARGLAVVLAAAQSFAEAFDKAIAAGQVTLPVDLLAGNVPLQRWDRAAGVFVHLEASKKPPKEATIAVAAVPLEQWLALAEQVAPPSPGARECFLAALALPRHVDAAREHLTRLRSDDDLSGTGAGRFGVRSVVFEVLLRRLPENDDQAWAKALRFELQAGQRLAAGLVALSERRNQAAAGHFDRLLTDHARSYTVLMLP